MNDPMQAARGLRDQGMKMGQDGELAPTQNWGGLMGKASQQMNSLSRGARAGEGSGLGGALNTMYDREPGGFNRGGAQDAGSFGQMLAQTREQRIAQAQKEGTFGTIRDKYNQDNAATGSKMNQFGNIMADLNKPQSSEWLTENRPVQFDKSGLPKLPWAGDTAESGQRVANRQALEQAAEGIKLRREATGELPTVTTTGQGLGEVRSISGKYGSGKAETVPTSEALVNKRPFSEVMQGLANKPGIARNEDQFQSQNSPLASAKQTGVKSASDLLKSPPKKQPFTTIPEKYGKQMLASTKRKPLARASWTPASPSPTAVTRSTQRSMRLM